LSELTRSDYFPTTMWHAVLDDPDVDNYQLYEAIKKLLVNDSGGVQVSNRIGWQSKDKLHTLEEFSPLCKRFNSMLLSIYNFLKAAGNAKPAINQCWANINTKYSYNVTHCHANSYYSGAYYVKVPDDSGDIVFYDPRPQLDALRTLVTEVTMHTAPEVRFKPQEGMVIIFPSWLMHRVEPNMSDEERVSIAFNTWTF